MPPRCPASCRIVICAPLSGKDAAYRCTGASTSIFPSSTSRISAAAVSGLDTLPMPNTVDGVARTPSSTFAQPNPALQTTSPPRATATASPGTRAESHSAAARSAAMAWDGGTAVCACAGATAISSALKIDTPHAAGQPRRPVRASNALSRDGCRREGRRAARSVRIPILSTAANR